MLENNVLYALLTRDNYVRYRNFVSTRNFSRESLKVLHVIDEYHRENEDDLSLDDLVNRFFAANPPDDYYKAVFASFENKQPVDSFRSLLEAFKSRKLCEDISASFYEASQGSKSIADVLPLVEELSKPQVEEDFEFVSDDIDELLDHHYVQPGLKFRLGFLRRALGSLRKGDFGFIVARPEVGKTALICSEVSHMAEQIPQEEGPALWFNMEDQGGKVKIRVIQASLGATSHQINENRERALQKYLERTHGKIKIFDHPSPDKHLIERMCEKYKPSLLVFDQLDKISGFNNDREDLRLGQIYIWARGLAKRYCPVIGVSQSDGSGEGQEFLTMANISNSKTSKAAEADWILGIGAKHDGGSQHLRGLSILKNKLIGDSETVENERHGKRIVLIRPEVQRYLDAE